MVRAQQEGTSLLQRVPVDSAAGLLPQSFYERDVLTVARALLGKHIVHGPVSLRITEVEAYGGLSDSASHAFRGQTPRNAPMWGPAGRVYVYLCYGIHQMFNMVTGGEGEPSAVLVRACEVLSGHDVVFERRGLAAAKKGVYTDTGIAGGPGKVGQALGVDRTFSHHELFLKGGIEVRDGASVAAVVEGPRIGIGYATQKDQHARYRFAVANAASVTYRSQLK